MRGLRFREGHHDFSILPGGLVVYPRMVAGLEKAANGDDPVRTVALSGIEELDSLLGGGIHFGTSTLVMGPAGAGKSTFLTQYALSLARAGKQVACYVFEETRGNFFERARGLGMDLAPEVASSGNMTVE